MELNLFFMKVPYLRAAGMISLCEGNEKHDIINKYFVGSYIRTEFKLYQPGSQKLQLCEESVDFCVRKVRNLRWNQSINV